MEKIFEDFLDNVQIDDEELQDDIDGTEIQYEYRLEFDIILDDYLNKINIDAIAKDMLRLQKRLSMMFRNCPQISDFSKFEYYTIDAFGGQEDKT